MQLNAARHNRSCFTCLNTSGFNGSEFDSHDLQLRPNWSISGCFWGWCTSMYVRTKDIN